MITELVHRYKNHREPNRSEMEQNSYGKLIYDISAITNQWGRELVIQWMVGKNYIFAWKKIKLDARLIP